MKKDIGNFWANKCIYRDFIVDYSKTFREKSVKFSGKTFGGNFQGKSFDCW